jgi:TolB protein
MVCGKGSPQIYTCDAQGRGAVARTRGDAVKSSPCWSPDGSQILFAMDPGPQLYVIPASGGTAQRVSSAYSYMAEPDWSRTNRDKVVCTVREGGVFKIAVLDMSARTAKVVSKAAYDAVEASWLADGRHVICTMRDARSSVLAILDTESGNSFRVSTVAQAMQAGVWMP